MSKITALLIILLAGTLSTTCFAQQWTVKYARSTAFDNLGSDNKAYSIAAGDNGCVYVAGYSGALNVSSICLVKYGPNGDTIWTRAFPDSIPYSENKAYAVTVDHQWNIIVTGFTTSGTIGADIFTRKYSPNGDTVWTRFYNGEGNGDDKAYAITVDSYDNIYVTGFTTGISQGTDYVTIRYDADGTEHWVKHSDGPVHCDTATSITMVTDNYVAVTGCMKNSNSIMQIVTLLYNANTGVQAWIKIYQENGYADSKGNAITSDNQGNVYVTGYTTGSSNGKDIAILKIDLDGNLTAIQPVDISGYDDIGNSIGLSGNGDVLVTGVTSAGDITTDNYITLSYSSDGISQWHKICNGTGDNTDIAYKMAVSTTENAVYVTGSSKDGSTLGSTDMVTIKYDITTGDVLDSACINTGSTNVDVAYDITIDSQQNVYITGYTMPIGGTSLATNSSFLTAKFGKGKLSSRTITRNIPKNFKLYQNYPNPFNPSTTIKFEISKFAKVKLVIYDVLGREVQTLINKDLNAGAYSIPFSNPGISSGIYFYEFTAGDFRDIKKMVILK